MLWIICWFFFFFWGCPVHTWSVPGHIPLDARGPFLVMTVNAYMVKCSLRDKSAISEDHCFQKTAFPKQTFPGLSLLQNDISLRTLTLLGQPTPVTDRWLVQRPGHLGFLDVITKGPSRIKLCMGSAGPGTGPDSHFILSSSLLQLLSSLLPRCHSWNIC